MSRFWKREDELERRLRARGSEPHSEFVRSAVARVVDGGYRRRGVRIGGRDIGHGSHVPPIGKCSIRV